MTVYDFDTRAALLESGKAQFLEHGFGKSSLRTICANAGVTTGSFYLHFKHKEDLFTAIVEDNLAENNVTYEGLMDYIVKRAVYSNGGEDEFMGFVMEHRDLFKLLFDCSAGTPYEGFKDAILVELDASCQEAFSSYAGKTVDADLVHTIVRMKFAQYCEMIYGDYDKEKVEYLTDRIGTFTKAGFEALLQVK